MSHKIQKQVLQLDIPSGHDSWRFQNALRDTFNQQVLPRLEKVCNELGLDEGTVMKIDTLLLDTGEVSSVELSSDWASQIEYQFREQIKRLKIQGPTPTEKVEVQTSEQSALTALLHFLKLGVLPWWAKGDKSVELSILLRELLEQQGQAFINQLKKLPNREQAINRLIKLTDEKTQALLLKACQISTPLSEEIRKLYRTLKISHGNEALLRLDALEVISKLQEVTAKAEDLLYQWVIKEMSFGETSKESIKKLHKYLFNSILNPNKEVILNVNISKSLTQVFDRLEGEKKLSKSRTFDQFRPSDKPNTTRQDQADPSAENESSSPENSTELSPFEQAKRRTKEARKASKSSAASSKEENLVENKPNADSPHSSADQSGETESSKADDKTSQPLNAEDEHVFKQLQRIREAARQSQAEASGQGVENGPGKKGENTESTSADQQTGQETEQPKNAPTTQNREEQKSTNKGLAVTERETDEITGPPSTPSFYPYELPQMEVEECYVENAGLVLFWPFLSRFFKNLELVENNQFKSIEAQEKAAQLLQYLLSDNPEMDEFALPLNKLLCALPIEHPITTTLQLSDDEKAACQELLQSTIDNWGSLKGTSIPGFQGSFLNREGVLKKQEDGWLLQVEKQAFDMLLEQLPWPVSIVKLIWMNEPIYVEW